MTDPADVGRLLRDIAAVRISLELIRSDDPATLHLADVVALTRHTLDCVWAPVLADLDDRSRGSSGASAHDPGGAEAVDLDPPHQPAEPPRR